MTRTEMEAKIKAMMKDDPAMAAMMEGKVMADMSDAEIEAMLKKMEGAGKSFGNALKAISKTDDELIVENYIVLFGGRDLTGIYAKGAPRIFASSELARRNRDGSVGESFSPNTDFESSYTFKGVLDVDWEHGMDGTGADEIIGYVDWKGKAIDEKGIFVKRTLNRRNKYVQWLEPLIEAGMIGTSTEPIQDKVEKKSTGEIMRWALKRDTLTVVPFEPRMMTQNVLQAMKSLGIDTPEADAKTDAARKEDEQIKIAAQVAKDKKQMDEKEMKALTDSQAAQAAAIAEQGKQLAEVTKSLGEVVEVLKKERPAGSGVKVTHDEADTSYKSLYPRAPLGAFLRDVRDNATNGATSPQLKAILGSNESVSSEGGFLVQTEQAAGIEKKLFDEGLFASRCSLRTIGAGANSVDVYGLDEDSRANGSRYGGVTGYRVAEAATITASGAIKFHRYTLKPKEYAAIYYATNDVLQDAGMLEQEVMEAVPAELAFMLDDDIVNGLGAAGCLGFTLSAALVSVTRDVTSHFTYTDAVGMWSRMWARSRSNGVWFINQNVEPDLLTMSLVVGAGGSAVYLPPGGASVSPYGSLLGRPVVPTEFNASLGTVGDVLFCDMTQYALATKGGLQTAQSIHVQFLTNQNCFRFIARYDGQSKWKNALTPYKGTGSTLSPFVALAT